MLRILVYTILSMSIHSFALSSEYSEPKKEDIESAKTAGPEAIKKADSLTKDDEFKSTLKEQQEQIGKIKAAGHAVTKIPEDVDISKSQEAVSNLLSSLQSARNEGSYAFTKMRVIVLISFSMPDEEIRILTQEAEKLGASLVIRGLYKENLLETQKKIASLSIKGSTGIAIDPTLFSRFDAKSVPTFILPLSDVEQCMEASCRTPDYLVATGSVSISYFLDKAEQATKGKVREAIGRMRKEKPKQ